MNETNETAEVRAIFPIAVGGFVSRTPGQDIAVLTYILPNGEHLNIAMNDEMLAATDSKTLELRSILLETGETMRGLQPE